MAPPSGLHQSAASPDPLPAGGSPHHSYAALVRSSTVPVSLKSHRPDPLHLAPEDAFVSTSPPRRPGTFDAAGGNGSGSEMRPRRMRRKDASRSRSRRRKRFQKLLWVKQSYPDNYTDQATFLENLQRNPRVQPYDFWPLVADSTVIVQHVCSVIIFIVCFVGIFQERVSPVSVVGWGSFATFMGWLLWDWWVGQESRSDPTDGVVARGAGVGVGAVRAAGEGTLTGATMSSSGSGGPGPAYYAGDLMFHPPRRQDSDFALQALNNASTASVASTPNLPSSAASSSTNLVQEHHLLQLLQSQRSALSGYSNGSANSSSLLIPKHAHSQSVSSVHSATSHRTGTGGAEAYGDGGQWAPPPPSSRWGRAKLRLGTIKSAILIYFTLLGLSPILKSLTRSTSSDSIWSMSFLLLTINIFFFDYSGSWVGVHKFPAASLSTNAALMASTVLASRLPSTGQVFSLTLFSIEVFGLFPVFRRYARHRSWRYHVVLTVLLVLGAGGGVGMVLGAEEEQRGQGRPWMNGLIGMVVGCLISALAMGGCSWWLIGLQKYKNEIYGPWDPARPIIISRRHWDDE